MAKYDETGEQLYTVRVRDDAGNLQSEPMQLTDTWIEDLRAQLPEGWDVDVEINP